MVPAATSRCPAGHDSATTDFCDVCGASMAAPAPEPAPAPTPQACANCGAPRDGRFCEECGHDGTQPAPARPDPVAPVPVAPDAVTWSAVVAADRDWFEEVRRRDGPDAATLEFPRYCPERRFELAGRQLTIGRRSRSRGIEPEIDLTGPPLDPGVSTLHALLLPRDDGGWEVVDLDSTNGTTVGDTTALIPPNTPVPLGDGDVVKLGAWTTISLRAQPR